MNDNDRKGDTPSDKVAKQKKAGDNHMEKQAARREVWKNDVCRPKKCEMNKANQTEAHDDDAFLCGVTTTTHVIQ